MGRPCPLAPFGARAVRREILELRRGERPPAAPAGFVRLRVVLDGLVAMAAGLPDGRRQIIELEGPDDMFCGGVDRRDLEGPVWAEALTRSRLCALDIPEAAARDGEVMRALFGVAHGKLASATLRMIALGRLDGGERVCGFLVDMTRRIGRRAADGWRLRLPMSREDIADYLGLNPETVSRILGRLRQAGLARFATPTELLLPDLTALEARAATSAAPAPIPRAREQR